MLVDSMSSIQEIKRNFKLVQGASLSYVCGVVASQKAMIFSHNGKRLLQSVPLNSTSIRYTHKFYLTIYRNKVLTETGIPSLF